MPFHQPRMGPSSQDVTSSPGTTQRLTTARFCHHPPDQGPLVYAAHIVQVTPLPRAWHFKGMKEDISKALRADRCPAVPLTLHVLQVQEDGVLAHEVPQQLGHIGDAMRDDGQPLPACHVAPGQALHHEGPSSRWVLDQLHLPGSRRHWSRPMLVPGAPRP